MKQQLFQFQNGSIVYLWVITILLLAVACNLSKSLNGIWPATKYMPIENAKYLQVSSADTTGGNKDRITIQPRQITTLVNSKCPGCNDLILEAENKFWVMLFIPEFSI
ncbi:MAG: hypothetical protein RLZZ241_290 [Bacteroidota bacterium]|jgi:protein-disulfide isomerase